MLRAILRYTILFLILSFFPLIAYGQEEDIVLYADNIISDGVENYIYAKGNVYVTMGDSSLFTDSLLFDKRTQTIYVFQKAVFYGDFIATGDYLKYNLKTKEGYLSKGEINFPSEDIKKKRFLFGEDIIIRGKGSFSLSKGGMSGCEGEKKAWHIEGNEINVEEGEYLTSKGTSLYFSSLPVFYTPYFIAPVKKERESGFLIPSIGFSGKNGLIFRIPYYTVIDDSSDLTNTLLVKTKTTVGLDNQYRYMWSPYEMGELNLNIIDNFEINKLFLDVKLKHSKEKEKENLKLNLDYVNRKNYFNLYAENSEEKTKPYTRSVGFYEKKGNRDMLGGVLFFSQSILDSNNDFRYFTLSKEGYLKQNGNMGYNYRASLSAFSFKGESTTGRLVLEPFFLYRLNKEDLTFWGRGNLKLMDYTEESDNKDNQLKGLLYSEVGSYVDKTLIVNDKYRVVNTMKGEFMLPYMLTSDGLPNFDIQDTLDVTKKFRYSFEQKWYNLVGLKQIFYFSLWQEYLITNKFGSNKDFSDLFFVVNFSDQLLNVNGRGSYDHNSDTIREIALKLDTTLEGFKLATTYYHKELSDEYLNIDLSKKIGYNTSVLLGTRYDLKRHVAKEASAGFDYLGSCYSVKTVITRKDLPREYIIMVTLNLFGLGEIKEAY